MHTPADLSSTTKSLVLGCTPQSANLDRFSSIRLLPYRIKKNGTEFGGSADLSAHSDPETHVAERRKNPPSS